MNATHFVKTQTLFVLLSLFSAVAAAAKAAPSPAAEAVAAAPPPPPPPPPSAPSAMPPVSQVPPQAVQAKPGAFPLQHILLCAAGIISFHYAVFRPPILSFLLYQAPAVKPAAPEPGPPTIGGRGESRVTHTC